MKFAMLLNEEVIDIVERDDTPYYPPTPNGEEILAKNIEKYADVRIGMIYDKENDCFYEQEPFITPTIISTNEIADSQLIIMEALAEQYEESLEKDLNNMEVQATIYEAILEMGGIQ